MKIVSALAAAALIGVPAAASAQAYHGGRYDDGHGGAPAVRAAGQANVNAGARVPLSGGPARGAGPVAARAYRPGDRDYRYGRDAYGRDAYGRDAYGRDGYARGGAAFVGGLAAGAALADGYYGYGYGEPYYGYGYGDAYGSPDYAYDTAPDDGGGYAPDYGYADQGAYYGASGYAPATYGATATYSSTYSSDVGGYDYGAAQGYAGYTGGAGPVCGQWAWDPVMGRYVWSC